MAEVLQPEVVIVGGFNHDVVLSVARLPRPGETRLSRQRMDAAGGKGANQAVQAARCGARVALVAALGRDAVGEGALQTLALDGVDTAHVVQVPDRATGMAVILVDEEGENCIVVDSGANACLDAIHVEAASKRIATARLVAAQLETSILATQRAFQLARRSGGATLLNAAPAPEAALPMSLLELTDILVVNEGEGEQIAGTRDLERMGTTLLEKVGEAVVVTLGARGARLFRKAAPPLSHPAYPVSVVDTTGAGDAFIGAFAARYAETVDLEQALRWGLAAGALACGALGAAPSFAKGFEIGRLAAGLREPIAGFEATPRR